MNISITRGRLARDPELRYTQSGKAFCKFTMAVTKDFNKEQADFINYQAWDKTAEIIAEYARKGKELLVEGRIQTGSYDKDDGTKVYTTDIVVGRFEFIGSKKEESSGATGGGNSNPSTTGNSANPDMEDEDSFPFLLCDVILG